MLLTPELARDIAAIVEAHYGAMAAAVYGPESVTPEEWQLAVDLGLVDPDRPERLAHDLHAFGAVLAHLDQAGRQARYGDTHADFVAEVARHPIPQTAVERHAADWSARRGAALLRGLGNKVGATVGSSLINADEELGRRLRDGYRAAAAANLGDEASAARLREIAGERGLDDDFFEGSFRGSVSRVVSDMGHATGDWGRDIQRVAHTEGHKAVQEGLSSAWREEDPAHDPLVYKIPRPGACAHCVRLHLDGAAPRLYRLSTLQGNGDNVGRRARDWRAVVGPVHPWCGCDMFRVSRLVEPELPAAWREGEAAPSVVGPGGRIAWTDPEDAT